MMKIKAAAFLAVILLTRLVQAESTDVSLQGTVLDPTRSPIMDAQITATRNGRNMGSPVTSDENGRFVLIVEPGKYTLQISAKGFSDFSQSIDIQASGSQPREFVMQLATVQEIVTVTESPDYLLTAISSATKVSTPLRDVPQSITVVTQEQLRDQLMTSVGDVVRYIPGVTSHQGENNRDQIVIRGSNSSADFFVNGVRDDVQYYRDLYNIDRVEALKGPNAMIFGRGGGGGVINRVTKQAGFMPLREITVQGGSFNNKRIAVDVDKPVDNRVALRINTMFENSGSFRDHVSLERYGINPTLTIVPSNRTTLNLSYENFRDTRTADRGLPSFGARPAEMPVSTFVGNPDESHVRARVNIGTITLDHQTGSLSIRNRTHFADYDRGYQNFVPSTVSADKTQISLSAYNNATARFNVFNQTDLTYGIATRGIRHTILSGTEIGRQLTDNFRNTGYFNNAATSILVPFASPTINTPVTFRQSATDADNHLRTNLGAAYVQDQMDLSRYVHIIAGLRFDYFDLQYRNNRTDESLRRIDHLTSPRAGIVIKPVTALSLYGNYTVSYLPSSGDQFSSLTTVTQQVKPEKFANYELGLKWDVRRNLSLTTAMYRLNRMNTRATDPNDPTRIIQTGSQRSEGFELGLNGTITRSWKVAGGYAYQDANITSATVSARAGARVAQVPRHTFSLWNNYQLFRRLGTGMGVIRRSDMYAAIDNTVVLPGYTRADAALFVSLNEKTRVQANLENIFDRKYYVNADSNTNISPGSTRSLRMALVVKF